MINYLKKIFQRMQTTRSYLLGANVFLVGAMITFSNLGVLPLKNVGDFIFFALIFFLLALYRPGWSFLFFIGTIALENINLAPESLGIMLRPYQLIGILTLSAVAIRSFSGRLNFKLPKIKWEDFVALFLVLGGFISTIFAPDKGVALKQSVIIFSFFLLYALVRIFIQTLMDIKKIIPFILSSTGVIAIYGIWQNWQFLRGKNSFEVMPGRANATFTEADWLGMFLVLVLVVLYVMAYAYYNKIKILKLDYKSYAFPCTIFVWKMIVLVWIVLIIAVSRSAWLGAVIITISAGAYFTLKNRWQLVVGLVASIMGAILLVWALHLSNFNLTNRIESTASGEQEITISCQSEVVIPKKIGDIGQLAQYNCRHINLEDIQKEISLGNYIKKINRTDPNFNIRSNIYKKSWNTIGNNPIFGIGWGNISNILGNDDRGAGLNSSNIFLELWLGAGLIGLISFVVLVGSIIVRGKLFFFRKIKDGKFLRQDTGIDLFYLFVILSLGAIIIPNLFNAGIMLGFIWVWLAVAMVRD